MFRYIKIFTNSHTKVQKNNYATTAHATSARLLYSLKESGNKIKLNQDLKKNGFYVTKIMNPLLIDEKKYLQGELESINYYNTNKKNQAAIIQTQFGVHKTQANFTLYPCENESPFDVAYESLIEPRPILSSIAIQSISQLLNIEALNAYEGMLFSIVLLKYVMESYLPPHKDENYLFSLMTTLPSKNIMGANRLYTTDNQGMPGVMLGEFSDSYYKIVDNSKNGVFHDAHIKLMGQTNVGEEQVRYVLIAGIKNHFCRFWTKPSFMRSNEELLPINESKQKLKFD